MMTSVAFITGFAAVKAVEKVRLAVPTLAGMFAAVKAVEKAPSWTSALLKSFAAVKAVEKRKL